jgi:hypothetical protein
VRLDEARTVQHVGAQLRLIELGLHCAPLVIVSRVAAKGRKTIGCERDEAFDRGAPRNVLDVGIQPAVLVNDEHHGPRTLPGGLHEVAAHVLGVAAGRRVRDVLRPDP